MNILKELRNLEKKEDLYIELEKETLPLVMWGAGELAGEVNAYLKKHNIYLADVFVDDEYYNANKMFDGKTVISRSMVLKKYSAVNLILGNSNYEMKDELIKEEKFKNVFYLFSVNYGISDKTPIYEIEKNIHAFEAVYDLLEDNKSKENLVAFLKTRISGNNSYITDIYENESNFFNNEIFKISEEEVFLDIGAYDGDTIRLFLKENQGRYKCIYALEPDKENRNKLKNYIRESGLKNVIITQKGAWKKNGKMCFEEGNEQISGVIVGENEKVDNAGIDVDCLDHMFEYEGKVTLLKINYLEGVEEALMGARNILKESQPKLAITVGFDCRNIRCIPLLIKNINPNYKLYLRYNRGMISSLTCYGIV